MEEFSPGEAFSRALNLWWVIVALTILGGVLAWAFHFLQPPLYQAQAVFNISLNFAQTGSLTQFEEDHTWEAVGDLIDSTGVLEQVVKQANAEGIQVDVNQLERMITRERKEFRWVLQLRARDPRTAAILTNLWADEANRQLEEARQHAIQAYHLHQYLTSLESCLSSHLASGPSQALCNTTTQDGLQKEMAQIGTALQQETALAGAILPSLTFELVKRADIPTQPAEFQINTLVLAGGLIGFVLAIWITNTRWVMRLVKGNRRG